jgi:hypothetical protein
MAANPNILILYPAEEEAVQKFNKLKNFMKIMFPGFRAYPASAARQEPEVALEWAQVVILLIDQSFLASPLHQALRQRLFERLELSEIAIVPLLLADAVFPPDSKLSEINPAHRRPLSREADLDAVFAGLMGKWRADFTALLANLRSTQPPADPAQPAPATKPPITTPDHLADSLLYLNYSDQHSALSDYRKASPKRRFNPVNLFLLQGTPECAHDLLIKSFMEVEQIKVERQFINLPDFSASAENIWALVKSTLGIGGRSAAPANVGPKIVDILQNNHLVLQLENIHIDRANYIAAINTFWHTLYQDYLIPKQDNLAYGLFLFVTDKACDCQYEPRQFVPPAQLSAWQRLVGILPPISRLFPQDLDEWTEELRRLRQDAPRHISEHLESRIPTLIPNADQGSLMLDTINAIIKACHLEQQKDRIYQKLEIWLEEEH